ncbi:hypothetical protein IMG5_159670 [Ichthyophthirius multifiliis]|uniref:Transmembrane protein n=1 Tax=Ichthyophthirius multifiliis TaxID=5932 RepID=G0QZT5_ICHMU|nr:hypothetical protein IMG5_159670 [Ichthyophthirius multifiliis]EGR29273.1 hypothetical protein IMG5_159670 [Ichthyophthirius multifiliis]|eukprot:XP_004030509.1 hypothetical protein IMG5_159670 [Ichthyophthirius multifiliis]
MISGNMEKTSIIITILCLMANLLSMKYLTKMLKQYVYLQNNSSNYQRSNMPINKCFQRKIQIIAYNKQQMFSLKEIIAKTLKNYKKYVKNQKKNTKTKQKKRNKLKIQLKEKAQILQNGLQGIKLFNLGYFTIQLIIFMDGILLNLLLICWVWEAKLLFCIILFKRKRI